MAGVQIRGFQIGDGELTQLHHKAPLAHVAKVRASNVISADETSPPGSPTVGDTYIPAATATGDWAGKEGHAMEWDGSSWIDHGTVSAGQSVRLSSTVSGATFTGHANEVAEKTASAWTFHSPRDGFQCVQLSATGGGLWDKEVFCWNNDGTAWVSVAESMSVASTDNALDISNGQITHAVSDGTTTGIAGHVWTSPNGYGYGQVAGDSASEPGSPVVGYTYIATQAGSWSGTTVAVGDYVYWDGNSWTVIGSRTSKDLVLVSPTSAIGSFASHENDLASWNGTTYSFVTPRSGDGFHNPPSALSSTKWDGVTWLAAGTSLVVEAQDPSEIAGDGIEWDTATRVVKLDLKANSGLEIDAGELKVGPTESGNPLSTTNKVVDTAALSTGISWKDPSEVLRIVDDSLVTAPSLGSGDAGKAYQVAGTGGDWVSYAINDIVEWDGSNWNLVLAAGSLSTSTRVTVVEANAAGSFQAYENRRFVWNGSGWTIEAANQNGDSQVIVGTNSIYENDGYTWDSTPGEWHLTFTGQYTGGDGIDITGQTISVDADSSGGVTADFQSGGTVGIVEGNGIDVGAGGLAVDVLSTGGLTNAAGAGTDQMAVVEGDGIAVDAGGVSHSTHYAHETPTYQATTHQFADPGKSLVEATVRIYRNGILQKKVASNPVENEYTWNNGTRTMTVGAQFSFEQAEDVAINADLT